MPESYVPLGLSEPAIGASKGILVSMGPAFMEEAKRLAIVPKHFDMAETGVGSDWEWLVDEGEVFPATLASVYIYVMTEEQSHWAGHGMGYLLTGWPASGLSAVPARGNERAEAFSSPEFPEINGGVSTYDMFDEFGTLIGRERVLAMDNVNSVGDYMDLAVQEYYHVCFFAHAEEFERRLPEFNEAIRSVRILPRSES